MKMTDIPSRIRFAEPEINPDGVPTFSPRFRAEVDPTNAVLLDQFLITQYDVPGQTGEGVAMYFGGRINRSKDRADILYVMDQHAAARVMAQMMCLYGAIGPEFMNEVMEEASMMLHGMSTTFNPLDDIE